MNPTQHRAGSQTAGRYRVGDIVVDLRTRTVQSAEAGEPWPGAEVAGAETGVAAPAAPGAPGAPVEGAASAGKRLEGNKPLTCFADAHSAMPSRQT